MVAPGATTKIFHLLRTVSQPLQASHCLADGLQTCIANGCRRGSSNRPLFQENFTSLRRSLFTQASEGVTSCGSRKQIPPSMGHRLRGLYNAAKPAAAKEQVSRIQQWLGVSGLSNAISLQLSSLWQRYNAGVYLFVGVMAAYLLWRTTFRLASMFVDLTESLAEFGLLGLAATIVAGVALYLRSYYNINPARVYRQAMFKLNTNPAVLEVLGAPLVGGDVQVTVMSGGGLKIKSLKFKRQTPRVQMMFKLSGPERQGLVSVEAKKKKGQYIYKLLAVDAQPADSLKAMAGASSTEPAARVFVEGDPERYNRGGLLWDLRKPYLAALKMQEQFELEDEVEDEMEKLAVPKSKESEQAKEAKGAQVAKAPTESQPKQVAADAKEQQGKATRAGGTEGKVQQEVAAVKGPAPGSPGAAGVAAASPKQSFWQRIWGVSAPAA